MTSLSKVLEHAPKVISEASKGPLAAIALALILLTALAFSFFGGSSDVVKVAIFALVAIGFAALIIVLMGVFSKNSASKRRLAEIEVWHRNSAQSLKAELEKVPLEDPKRSTINAELEARNKVKDLYSKTGARGEFETREISHEDVVGVWSIVGHNPYSAEDDYFGSLTISPNSEVLSAEWDISSGDQTHTGVGFLYRDMLVFAVSFDDHEPLNAGVVAYELFPHGVMRGVWTGYDSGSLGYEEGRRANEAPKTTFTKIRKFESLPGSSS